MKKIFTFFLLTLSLWLGFSSCSDEAVDVDTVNKQTIFVFYPWSGGYSSTGLTSNLKANVDSICAGIKEKKGLNNTRVMVFFSESKDKSVLYDLQYDETQKEVSRVPIKTYDGITYNTAQGLADIINDVKSNAEALNYAMIIGCHGCGWTYSEDWEDYPNKAKPYIGTSPISENFSGLQFGDDANNPLTRFFGSVSLSEGALNVNTLADAIQMSGIKMQYILFDACYMGNVETAYALKDATNFLIASSSEILAAGIPYKSLWNYLNGPTPNYSSIVSGAVNFYKNTAKAPYCNMAAIDCRQLDKLASSMKAINEKYTLASTVSLDSIQPLDGFSPTLFFDMKVYVDSLCPSGVLKDNFTNQLKETVKSSQTTDSVITSLGLTPSKFIKIKSYCGLSISDPSQNSVAIKGKQKTGWWKATH